MEKDYENEEQFLKEYDSSIFDKPSVTADIAVFSVSSLEKENYRRLTDKKISILLVKRKGYPFKDKWCLPGGFVKINEELDDTATRVLYDETNMKNIYLEQLYTFSSVKRDPRMRVISTSYVALIDKTKYTDKLNDNATWFDITINEDNNIINITLENEEDTLSFSIKSELKDRTTNTYNYEIIENNSLAFDHPLVIITGMMRLKNKLEYTNIVFNMMPKEFTLGELQQVYEVILGKKLLDPAFRRIIADKVVKTNNYKTGGGHRPSALYKFNDKK